MGGGNLTAVFCDTGWEHPDTYKHVNDVCLQMGVRLITLKSKYDFVSLAAHKKRFPSTNARFCTSELKMKPMIEHYLTCHEIVAPSHLITQAYHGVFDWMSKWNL